MYWLILLRRKRPLLPDAVLVIVGDGDGGLLGGHVRAVEEAGPKVVLRAGEADLRLHPTAPQGNREWGAIGDLGVGKSL